MVVLGEGVIVEKTVLSLLYDEAINKGMEHCNAVDEDDVIVSSHDNMNVDNSVTGRHHDVNIIEDKHLHAMDKNSGDDAMASNKKCACCFWWR
ncbi:TIR-NBS-LRR RCT1 resistance protein [Trifolium medium]|uniref:TIR-NBS-LRR RCT1 resistance protein n=1 Tax=Trifolium medium TaxID=97028 RepID=A0A392MSV9_9FABA|nr:TIR-NBS-LRR RCT1 resistance protein [Trifolium medium]